MSAPAPSASPVAPAAPAAQSAGGALRTLLDLSRRGELAARYPEVPGLLAGLDSEELLQAGRLLARVTPDRILAAWPRTPVVSVAVVGHGTPSVLTAPLTAQLARHGLAARISPGRFDGYVAELGDPASPVYAARPDLTVCLLDPEIVFDEVPIPWTAADAADILERKIALVERLAEVFSAAPGAGTLVLNTLPLPPDRPAQLLDYPSRAELGARWREANARLCRLPAAHPSVVVLDLDPLIAEGIAVTEPRMRAHAGVNLSPALLARYAREIGHLARLTAGRTRKVLAVDLDGTLWGGVLGDDGMEGLELGGAGRGAAFRTFQAAVKQLGSQGVLLAVISKNDQDAVLETLRGHPGMVLGEADFVHVDAAWTPKPERVAALAGALNLDISALVFVDNSPAECGLVAARHPEVAVVRLGEEPADHVAALLRDGWFATRELTTADRDRTEQYRREAARARFREGFDVVQDYLDELGVWVRLAPLAERDTARVSQLTLRTNQFNCTGLRMQPHEVRAYARDPASRVLTVHSGDRFGESGLVGAFFLDLEPAAWHIRNLLLSCRVFGRGVEQACLGAVLRLAADRGAGAVHARFVPTPKNTRFAGFYPDNGFTATGTDGLGFGFRHDLIAIAAPPGHLRFELEGGF